MRTIRRNVLPLALALLLAPAIAVAQQAGSAYFTDEANVYVEERSAQALGIINEILCSIEQTGYAQLLAEDDDGNVPPYVALVDLNQCSQDRDSAEQSASGSQGQGSAAQVPDYEEWIVQVSQPGHTGPLTYEAWINQSEGPDDMPMQIRAKAVVTEGPSADNPNGLFRIDFVMYPVDESGNVNTAQSFGRGYLQSVIREGQAVLEFVNNMGLDEAGEPLPEAPWRAIEAVALHRSGQGAGSGTTYQRHEGDWDGDGSIDPDYEIQEGGFNFAYDTDNFLRSNAEGQVCLDKHEFNTNVWRYGLYDSASGVRVNRDSGFSVTYTDDANKKFHGWIGYWGMWFPEEAEVPHGANVTKQIYGPDGETRGDEYEVFAAGGKLVKHTRQELSLGELKNVPMAYWINDTDYRVAWDGAKFVVEAKRGENGIWEPTDPDAGDPEEVDLNAQGWNQIHFWSQERGGSLRVTLDCVGDYGSLTCAADNDSPVVFHAQDVIYPGDTTVPDELLCLENCPQAENINDADTQNDFYTTIQSWQDIPPASASRVTYLFDASTYRLQDGSEYVEQTSTPENSWGVSSGALFPADSLGQLACDWDDQQTCGWKAWDLDVFYTWETGEDDWRRFTGLKVPGDDAFLSFDPPLTVKYRRQNEDSTHATYILEYAGFGDLHGIPGVCVDWDTGDVVQECGQNTRWVSEFSIGTGESVCAGNYVGGTCDGTEYLVKALEMEKQMKAAGAGSCDSLDPAGLTLPDIEDWQDPAIGVAPEVAGARVIGGVIQ